jgi:LL-diaminopimelate aminotransferase
MFDAGNGVVPEPVYPAYEAAIILSGHQVRRVPTSEASGWLPDMKFTRNDSFFYFCDPNNPTGAVAEPRFYDELLARMKQSGVTGIFDKAYKDYVFDNTTKPVSITRMPELMEYGYEVVSLSKHANFVGIGLGWLVSSKENIDRWLRFEGQYGQGVPWYTQKAAVDALTNPKVKAEVADYMRNVGARGAAMVNGLNSLGLKCHSSAATPYVWVKVPDGQNDESFVLDKLLGKAHVAFMPGSYFGASGAGYFRATLFLSQERIGEALRRIAAVRDW